MASLSQTFIECSLALLGTTKTNEIKNASLVEVIETLDLSPSNLSVSLVYIYKYKSNSVNTLDCSADAELLHYYIIIASLILANKFLNDSSYTIKTWQSILHKCSYVFRPSLQMLNQIESHVLAALDFVLSTKHDPRLWGRLRLIPHRTHVMQLRMAVNESEFVPQRCEDKAAMPSPSYFGLATPPSAFTNYTSPMSVSTSPNGPFPPVSRGVPLVGSQFLQIYPSPLVGYTRVPNQNEYRANATRQKFNRSACGVMGSHVSLKMPYLLVYDF